jgi:prepilin-type N-terminal cleavage/methylation domain-containing protein
MVRMRCGFTLIELLVVVAVIAVLMAILMPALQRVKHQARGVACQSNLKQWGLIFAMYADDHDSRLPGWLEADGPWPEVLTALWAHHRDTNDLFLCPMARKRGRDVLASSGWQLGSTFTAWSLTRRANHVRVDCSYGVNVWAQFMPESETDARYWRTIPGRGAARVPLLADSVLWWAFNSDNAGPPQTEDIWTENDVPCCIDRHHGHVNVIFMDWSIRRGGLKELWTFEWHRQYNRAGPWTLAGGVQPTDWPQWMRSFRDY